MESIKIGILGMGTVGRGAYKILQENRKKIKKYLGKDIEIKKVLVKNSNKNRNIDLKGDAFTSDFEIIVNDPEIQVIVEVMGGINPSYEYVKRALERGKHVVTANKALIATYGEELRDLANCKGVYLRYEASVGGGIPIINTLMESLSANEIEEIVGIVNGTTNYILTQMSSLGLSFEEALKKAQEKGYAEADPTSDIDGDDAAFKLSILSTVAFGIRLAPYNIPKMGIAKISRKDIEYAEKLGYKIKLIAAVKRKGDSFELYVHPSLIPNEHPLSLVNNEYNGIFVRGNAVGEIMLYGKGAGSFPTGSAVLGDILNICKLIENSTKKQSIADNDKQKYIINEGISKYYIRLEATDKPGVLGKISLTFGKYDVSIDSVVQRARGQITVPLVFITHEVKYSQVEKALKEISSFEVVKSVASVLRVEDINDAD